MALAEVYNFQHTTEIDKAEPLLRRALELDPNYFPALYALGALRFCCQNRIADGMKTGRTGTAAESHLHCRAQPSHSHVLGRRGSAGGAEQLLADSSHNQSAWIPIYAYRHEWQKAAAIMYDETTRANLPIPPDARYGYFAVLMGATDSTSTSSARSSYFKSRQESAGRATEHPPRTSRWAADMSVEIGLAELMMRAGDEVAGAARARDGAVSIGHRRCQISSWPYVVHLAAGSRPCSAWADRRGYRRDRRLFAFRLGPRRVAARCGYRLRWIARLTIVSNASSQSAAPMRFTSEPSSTPCAIKR